MNRRRTSAHWGDEEVAILLREWSDCRERALRAKLPRRGWRGICRMARKLGLPPKDQGRESVTAVADRLGCSPRQLLKILDAAGVRVYASEPIRGRASTVRFRRQWTDADLAECAYRAWFDLEPLAGAAKRRGVHSQLAWRWAIRSGAVVRRGRGRPSRLPSSMIDRIIETRGREPLTFDLATYLRVEVARRIAEGEREAIQAAQRAEVVRWVRPREEARRAS